MLVIPHLILRKSNEVLLTRRSETQKIWAKHWHCVTGGIEEGETPRQAIIREAREEIGIKLNDVALIAVVSLVEKDFFDSSKKFHATELFFLADLPQNQTPVNLEPLKQDAMDWFALDNLPSPMIPGVKFGLQCYVNKINYAEFINA